MFASAAQGSRSPPRLPLITRRAQCVAPRLAPESPSLMTRRTPHAVRFRRTPPPFPAPPSTHYAPRAARRASHRPPLAHDAPLAARRSPPPHGASVPRPEHRCFSCMYRAPCHPLLPRLEPGPPPFQCHPPFALRSPHMGHVYMAAEGTRRPSRSRPPPRLAYPCICPSELRAVLSRFFAFEKSDRGQDCAPRDPKPWQASLLGRSAPP